MTDSRVHFEIYARKNAKSDFVLKSACADRAKALETAKEILAEGRAVAVKVTKETRDPETGEFQSIAIFNQGDAKGPKTKTAVEEYVPLCVTASDLYTVHARERIGRLLEDWLLRQKATPFELLHRPDLVEKLEASGVELQHAIQKIAIPEAAAGNGSLHEVIRKFQKLAQQAIDRLLADRRKKSLPSLERESFAALAEQLLDDPDRLYRLGAAVAGDMALADSWSAKVTRLLDLADAAPDEPRARAFAFEVIEQPLTEILAAQAGLADLLGPDLDLGASLAALTRLAAPECVDALIAAEPAIGRLMPPLTGPAARLANWLDGPHFKDTQGAVGRRVLRELHSPRRLRPSDPDGEIDILRALAMALTTAAGKVLPLEDIREAFVERSATLVASDFITGYLGTGRAPMEECQALLRLAENVTGGANKRRMSQWLFAEIGSLKLERELLSAAGSPAAKLAALADLQRGVGRVGLPDADRDALKTRLGELGRVVEAATHLILSITKSHSPPARRLVLLLKLAGGQAAPIGPVTDRAKAEAMRLIRSVELREELIDAAHAPDDLLPLMQAAGLAA